MAARIIDAAQSWMGTSGLSSGAQLISATTSRFIATVASDTSAIPPYLEEINLEALESLPRTVIDFEGLFQRVTEQYRRGELTLGEAAELLGMNRYEYDARLKELGIIQEPEPRTNEDISMAQGLIRELRKQ